MAPVNLSGLTVDPAHPLSRGLVGWWLMNDGAGTGLRDISRYANHGIITATSADSATAGWTGHRFGRAYRFDAATRLVAVPNAAFSRSMGSFGEFTVSCWVSLSSKAAGTYPNIVGKRNVAPNYWCYPFGLEWSSDWSSFAFLTGNGTTFGGCLGLDPQINRIYHLVGVHTGGTAPGAKNFFYIDGKLLSSVTTTWSIANGSQDLYFGAMFNPGEQALNGTLANVRIYNRALSANDVSMLYTQPLAGAYNTVRKNFFIYPTSTPKQTRRSVVQAMNQIKQSTSTYPIQFLMLDSSNHISPKTGLTPTVKISKNGGAFTSPAGAVTELGLGWYQVAGNATDSNTLGPLLLNATAGGADPTDMRYEVVSHDPFVFPTPLDASGTRSAVGLASANLDTQLSAIPVSTRTALGMATNNLDAQLAAIPNANANADALLDRSNAIWTGWTVRKVLRVIAAVMAGKLTGANTSTKRFRDFLDTKDVVIATTAASGRTSITLDAS